MKHLIKPEQNWEEMFHSDSSKKHETANEGSSKTGLFEIKHQHLLLLKKEMWFCSLNLNENV